MTASPLTAGQRQALDELQRIAAANRALQILGQRQTPNYLCVDVSVDCSNLTPREGGLRLRPRERLTVGIPLQFPFTVPLVETPHTRWAGTAHVQWGRHLCLYLSPATEWNPSDGMNGFVQRLRLWLERAAAGELDAPGQPLHPPVAYPSSKVGLVVVGANAPRAHGNTPWIGVALLRQVNDQRVDLAGWRGLTDPWPSTAEEARAAVADEHATVILAAAVILPRTIAFEYPKTASAMVDALKPYGVDAEILLGLLGAVTGRNRAMHLSSNGQRDGEPAPPLYLLVGTPARGVVGQTERITDLAAWRFPSIAEEIADLASCRYSSHSELAAIGHRVMEIGKTWLSQANIAWARLYEARPEVVTSRDAATPASWLLGKKVVVLGAGALGAPIAEACVRSGARHVAIADHGLVHPGILVRQPYHDDDIGRPKAIVLAEHLRRIRPDTVVESHHVDVVTAMFHDPAAPPDCDLLIDATANRTVHTIIERRRTEHRDTWPALATVLIGHEATRGVATVSYPGSSGGGADILRRLNLAARADPTGQMTDVIDDIFPDPPDRPPFQPEPGCSDATFIGSAADVTGLAGQLLTGILHALTAENTTGMRALVVRMPTAPTTSPAGQARWLAWPNDLVVRTADRCWEVRLTAPAIAELRAEVRRGARVRNAQVETGGSLLGGFDPAAAVVWVDEATGPPPDSLLSQIHFQHGIVGVEEHLAARRDATARLTTFLGMWHSHPYGPASPSTTDSQGMHDLVLPVTNAPPRALLLIVGGQQARWESWLHQATTPDTYAHVVTRSTRTSTPPPPRLPVPATTWWPGGSQPPLPPPQRLRRRRRLLTWIRHHRQDINS